MRAFLVTLLSGKKYTEATFGLSFSYVLSVHLVWFESITHLVDGIKQLIAWRNHMGRLMAREYTVCMGIWMNQPPNCALQLLYRNYVSLPTEKITGRVFSLMNQIWLFKTCTNCDIVGSLLIFLGVVWSLWKLNYYSFHLSVFAALANFTQGERSNWRAECSSTGMNSTCEMRLDPDFESWDDYPPGKIRLWVPKNLEHADA